MTEQTTEASLHRKFAVHLFNYTWELLDKHDRSSDDNIKMVHAAHASRFHWGQVGTPLEFERGEWQISRVYAVLRRFEPALYHAKECLKICEANNIGDFDMAFAYEAMARAHSIADNNKESWKYLHLAKEAAEKIKSKEDKEYFLSELETISV